MPINEMFYEISDASTIGNDNGNKASGADLIEWSHSKGKQIPSLL